MSGISCCKDHSSRLSGAIVHDCWLAFVYSACRGDADHSRGASRYGRGSPRGVLSIWHVTSQGDRGETKTVILPLAIDDDGQRVPSWERHIDRLFQSPPALNTLASRDHLLIDTLERMMHRELLHRRIIGENRGYDSTLIGWVDVV
jgi:hypothetical protein